MRRFTPLLLTPLLLAGCTSPNPGPLLAEGMVLSTVDDAAGRTTLSTRIDGKTHRAVIARGTAPPFQSFEMVWGEDTPRPAYELVSLSPRPKGPLKTASLRWVFAQLNPEADLNTPDGERLENPDRAVRAKLLAELSTLGVKETLARLPALLRPEPRSEVFVALCQQPGAVEHADQLIAAAASDGALHARTFEGLIVARSLNARWSAFRALTSLKGLSGEQADALASLAPSLRYDDYEARHLETLIRQHGARQAAVVSALPKLESLNGRKRVLDALLERPSLSSEEIEQLADTLGELGYDDYEKQLLLVLVQKHGAPVPTTLAALRRIKGLGPRRAVLLALIDRKGLSDEDAREIAQVLPGLGYDAYEKELALELIGKPKLTVAEALAVQAKIGALGERRAVLMALIDREGLSREDAERLVGVLPSLGYDAYERELLLRILERARPSTAVVMKALGKIKDLGAMRDVLMALVRRDAQSDGKVLAEFTPRLGYDPYEKDVLLALAKRGVRHPVLEASSSVKDLGCRRDVLLALIGQSGLTKADADRIAAQVPKLGYDAYEAALLVELLKATRPSIQAVLEAAGKIKSSGERLKVLEALTSRADLSRAEANAVAATAPSIGYDAYEAKILVALVGKADAKAIKSSLRQIGLQRARVQVLEALLD